MCGLWAEVYFWKAGSPAKAEGNWDKVKEYAALSIDDRKMADSPLQIEVMFDPLSVSSSPVLSVNVVSDYGGAYLDIFADMWSPVTVEEEVLKLFSEDNYRKEFWIDPATNYFIKYELDDEGKYNVNVLWRVEEMNLMLAEACYMLGDQTGAWDYLHKVQSVRMSDLPAYTDVLTEIKNERRREFLGDSYCRWKDMKRYGISIERVVRKDNSEIILKSNDYRYTFIIPAESELQQNSNDFQNPGWNNQEK